MHLAPRHSPESIGEDWQTDVSQISAKSGLRHCAMAGLGKLKGDRGQPPHDSDEKGAAEKRAQDACCLRPGISGNRGCAEERGRKSDPEDENIQLPQKFRP